MAEILFRVFDTILEAFRRIFRARRGANHPPKKKKNYARREP